MPIKYQIIYWRDIPAQIKVKEGRNRVGRQLSQRFLVAIDETATQAGKTSAEDYLAEWRTSLWQEQEGDLNAVAEAMVADLEAAYPPERLRKLIRQVGLEQAEAKDE